MKESDFQSDLIDELTSMFPGAIITKMEPYIQGIPDLLILYKSRWALLECKKSYKDRMKPRPNQEYYIDILNGMSFASFIYPENKEEVLDELERSLKTKRNARVL